MHLRLAISFILVTVAFSYLAYCLAFTPSLQLEETKNLPTNTYIVLEGLPQDIRLGAKEITFYLNHTQVRAQGLKSIENKTLIVEGYVSRYRNEVWVQALRVKYAT